MSGPSRRWLEVRVRSESAGERAPMIVEGLIALGGRGAEEREGWYLTHLEAPSDLASFREETVRFLRAYTDLADIELLTDWREHEDWAETWKRGLGFRRITERLAVRPSWVPQPLDAPEATVVLDPGMAFGTAEHGTTRGCLRLLDGALHSGERVLDVGAGSGILAIAAALLGASEVLAIEADPLACEALAENVEQNRVQDVVQWTQALVGPGELAAHGPVDGVVANIESGTLGRLMPGFAMTVRPGGWLILSGIQATEWPPLAEAAKSAGFALQTLDPDGEWRSGLFRLLAGPASS